jgi:lysozyme
MYEEVKEEIKLCEGYVNKIYQCSEGFDTIFYGHKITPDDDYEHGIQYTKQEGELVFERDFQRTLEAAERLIGDRAINNMAKEVIINMVYQIGEGGVSKFKNMWKALDTKDYGEASFQMLDSLWAKQTPARAGKLAGKMRAAKEV